jgi:hypothetical protein
VNGSSTARCMTLVSISYNPHNLAIKASSLSSWYWETMWMLLLRLLILSETRDYFWDPMKLFYVLLAFGFGLDFWLYLYYRLAPVVMGWILNSRERVGNGFWLWFRFFLSLLMAVMLLYRVFCEICFGGLRFSYVFYLLIESCFWLAMNSGSWWLTVWYLSKWDLMALSRLG